MTPETEQGVLWQAIRDPGYRSGALRPAPAEGRWPRTITNTAARGARHGCPRDALVPPADRRMRRCPSRRGWSSADRASAGATPVASNRPKPGRDASAPSGGCALPTPAVQRQTGRWSSLVDNEAHVLWAPSARAPRRSRTPTENTIEDHALQIVAAGYLVARGGPGRKTRAGPPSRCGRSRARR
jgi:hypothetical protein